VSGACSTYGGRTGVCIDLVGNPKGKSLLARRSCRWENDMKMGLQEVGCGSIDLFDVAQDRYSWQALVSAVMHVRVA